MGHPRDTCSSPPAPFPGLLWGLPPHENQEQAQRKQRGLGSQGDPQGMPNPGASQANRQHRLLDSRRPGRRAWTCTDDGAKGRTAPAEAAWVRVRAMECRTPPYCAGPRQVTSPSSSTQGQVGAARNTHHSPLHVVLSEPLKAHCSSSSVNDAFWGI